jgi:hypothetical protein
VYFKYQPTVEGYYSIASMLDITANEINPVLIFYSSASSQNVSEYSKQIIDGGGVSNTYTKNFYHEVYRATGTETTIVFCITAESMTDAAFPIDIDFMLTRIGDYADDEIGEIVEPDSIEFLESLVGTEVLSPKGTFKYAAQIDPSLPNTLQSKYFALNPEDGFYHVYDKEKYADNNGYGPVLYAKLTQDCEVYVTGQDTYFNNAKPNQMFLSKVVGKATCSLHQLNGKNYIKFFYEMDYSDENNSKYRYKWAYRINNNGEETSVQIYFTSGYATPAVVDEYGQSDIANPTYKYLTKDGTFPVTEKIKQFLQDFAIASTLFRDGIGEAETGNSNSNSGKEIVKYTSDEDSQWLFACGYYE